MDKVKSLYQSIQYWVKGGIWAVIIYLVLLILALITPRKCTDWGCALPSNIFEIILYLTGLPVYFPLEWAFQSNAPIPRIYIRVIGYVMFFIWVFLLGAFVSWIFKKLRKVKERLHIEDDVNK